MPWQRFLAAFDGSSSRDDTPSVVGHKRNTASAPSQELPQGRATRPRLLKPRVLRLGLLVDGDVSVGILPEDEKVLVGGTGLRLVAFQKIGARELQVCQRSEREIQHDPTMINDLLELRGRFLALLRQQVALPAKVNGVQHP